ncbi:hypothetical protein E2C01_025966 [Portunus trituberculatus]|uniref:Uncharacterized protein n=1 Tax=Portunus trituberculatus TaxID=210409 RepID=A0A5B7EGX8_PORTR|nr:hypothetical protein [Portunus trituberculatus]
MNRTAGDEGQAGGRQGRVDGQEHTKTSSVPRIDSERGVSLPGRSAGWEERHTPLGPRRAWKHRGRLTEAVRG